MISSAAPRLSRARSLQSRSSLAVSSAALHNSGPQPCRPYHIGASAASLQSHRDPRRRVLRYRYMETISRRLSWDKSTRAETADKDVLKSAIFGSVKAPTGHSIHFAKVEELRTWSKDLASSGKTPQDVARIPADQLLPGSPMPAVPNALYPQTAPTPDQVLRATAGKCLNGFIDPITNRRVSAFTPVYEDLDHYGPITDAKTPSAKAAKTQPGEPEDYTSVKWNEPHGQQELTAEEESKNYQDLDKYTPTKIDNPNAQPELTPEEQTKEYDDLDKYKPVDLGNADAERELTAEEESKQYTDLNEYSQTILDDPNTPRKTTPEEDSKNYDDLHKYDAVAWNEPDGLPQPTAEEKSKSYDDLSLYGAVTWNEPDGLRRLTDEEQSKNYQDLSSYGAVAWSEPDGLRQLTPEEKSKEYDDLETYTKPFVASDFVLAAHEAAQQDPTPRGNVLPTKVDAPAHNAAAEYTDLHQYGPVRWNEPDGLRQPTPEELSKKYEDLHLYGGGLAWNEPDGARVLTPEEQSKRYRDLRAYSQQAASGPEVIPNRTHPEEASKAYKDLRSYVEYDNGDPATPRLHPEESSKVYQDLHKYSEYPNSGPTSERIHPEEASKDYEDLSEYPAAGFEEAQMKGYTHPEELTKDYGDLAQYQPRHFDSASQAYPAHPEELTKVYEDLAKYEPRVFDSPHRPYPTHPEEATKSYTDLYRYGPIQAKVDGKPLDPSPFTGTKPYISKDRSRATRERSSLHRSEDLDLEGSLTADLVRASVLRRVRYEGSEKTERERLASDMSWEASIAAARDALQEVKKPASSTPTGIYARDFPEEFSRSWCMRNSAAGSSLYPKDQDDGSAASAEDADGQTIEDGPSSMDESFPGEPKRLEPALARSFLRTRQPNLSQHERARAMADPYSMVPQGLQTSYAEECGNQATWPTFVRHFAAKAETEGEASRQSSGSGSGAGSAPSAADQPESHDESGLYKILVFDHSTKSISMAETRSCVPGSFEPLTPADAFVRLSTPAAFLSYLAPLTAHGYEIMSGSGDVLVFRKVRPAQPDADSIPLEPATTRPRINPVDMMGSPVAGNFASPTGFVNYDVLPSRPPVTSAPPPTLKAQSTLEDAKQLLDELSRSRKKGKRRTRVLIVSGVVAWAVTTVVLTDSLASSERRIASRVSTKA
ncbi:hypothetical protein S40288_01604 [Stachybotrys chartarum IBT 40288]|nr:hypothetical protein S40288_01604 [Stachybotrys chartarum IBT 40288]